MTADQGGAVQAAVPHVGPELPWMYHLQLKLTRKFVGPVRRRLWRRERELPPPLSGEEVLRRLVALPVSTWSYEHEPGVRHMGPMSQDFAAAFGLGRSNRILQHVDVNGVNVVALQALARRLYAVEKQLAELRHQVERASAVDGSLDGAVDGALDGATPGENGTTAG